MTRQSAMSKVFNNAYKGWCVPSKDILEKQNERESFQPLDDDDVQVWYVDNLPWQCNTRVEGDVMTDLEYWDRKVLAVIANGGTNSEVSIADLVLAIRCDDSLSKFEKGALIHKLWEAF
jgi:hypothetical protein